MEQCGRNGRNMTGRRRYIEQATEFLQKWQRVVTARLTESDKALAADEPCPS